MPGDLRELSRIDARTCFRIVHRNNSGVGLKVDSEGWPGRHSPERNGGGRESIGRDTASLATATKCVDPQRPIYIHVHDSRRMGSARGRAGGKGTEAPFCDDLDYSLSVFEFRLGVLGADRQGPRTRAVGKGLRVLGDSHGLTMTAPAQRGNERASLALDRLSKPGCESGRRNLRSRR